MKNIKIIMLLIGVLFFTSCESKSQTKSELKTKTVANNTVEKTYKLKGFNQSCCIGIVNYSLKEVNGFVNLKANVKKSEITVWFDKTKCAESEIKKAINKTSYKIRS
ncbi:heavy-metal-associated domain-containing protein [Tenacibaculum holothuriorum]|uniref:heavy-metal-associated domain-containing protein n=1 Tax=Tenacibaculum holothuriorum TaxID=1635173 RepID=UPI000A329171|nr:heavy-metal-associated domain-containing protein [Tenacibaculum holothuriorum]